MYRYAIVDDSKTFTLQAGTGGATLLITTGNVNFESQSVYTVLLTVDDDRGPSYSLYSNIVIRDVNEAPTDIQLSLPLSLSILLNVNEDVPPGTLVGTFSAADPDTWQAHRFRLLPNGNPAPPLSVDQPSANGTAYLRTNHTLDYDAIALYPVRGWCTFHVCAAIAVPLLMCFACGVCGCVTPLLPHQILVQATDNGLYYGPLSYSTTLQIVVNKILRPPAVYNQVFYINENAVTNTFVNVIPSQPRKGEALRFNITGGNTGNAFRVQECSGTIFVETEVLDFERPGYNAFNLSIMVTGEMVKNITVIIIIRGVWWSWCGLRTHSEA